MQVISVVVIVDRDRFLQLPLELSIELVLEVLRRDVSLSHKTRELSIECLKRLRLIHHKLAERSAGVLLLVWVSPELSHMVVELANGRIGLGVAGVEARRDQIVRWGSEQARNVDDLSRLCWVHVLVAAELVFDLNEPSVEAKLIVRTG